MLIFVYLQGNPLCPPILAVAHEGTVLLRAGGNIQKPAPFGLKHENMDHMPQGISGYDPDAVDMRGVFMAKGPGFKNDGNTYPPVEIVDMYALFCHLLGIDPKEHHDGVWDRIRDFLRNSAPLKTVSMALMAFSVVLVRNL